MSIYILLFIPIALLIKIFLYSDKIKEGYSKCTHGVRGGGVYGNCIHCRNAYAAELKENDKLHEEYQLKLSYHEKAKGIFQDEIRRLKKMKYQKLEDLRAITPYDFEKFIMEMFVDLGYKVTHTPQTNDGGMDGIAFKDEKKYLIECKRYDKNTKVSRPELQKFFAAIATEKADKGFFITTSSFSNTVTDFCRTAKSVNNINIELIDGIGLLSILKKVYPDHTNKTYRAICLECGQEVIFSISDAIEDNKTCSKGHHVKRTILKHDI